MGADFIGTIVPIRRTRDEAIKALHELNDEAITMALRHTHLDPEFDDGHFWSFDDNGEPQIIRETLIPELEKYVHITYDVAEGRYRMGGVARIDDVYFAIAGGPSWGDTPDYFDELEVTSFLGVTVDQGEYLTFVSR
jgi:hypothetical protein